MQSELTNEQQFVEKRKIVVTDAVANVEAKSSFLDV